VNLLQLILCSNRGASDDLPPSSEYDSDDNTSLEEAHQVATVPQIRIQTHDALVTRSGVKCNSHPFDWTPGSVWNNEIPPGFYVLTFISSQEQIWMGIDQDELDFHREFNMLPDTDTIEVMKQVIEQKEIPKQKRGRATSSVVPQPPQKVSRSSYTK
jgi:hypothetical protein